MEKEQAERERLRQENERRRLKEEDAIDKSMRGKTVEQTAPQASTPVHTPISSRVEVAKEANETDSNSPSHSAGQDKAAAERERQRLREQERRRREAVNLLFILLKIKHLFYAKSSLKIYSVDSPSTN